MRLFRFFKARLASSRVLRGDSGRRPLRGFGRRERLTPCNRISFEFENRRIDGLHFSKRLHAIRVRETPASGLANDFFQRRQKFHRGIRRKIQNVFQTLNGRLSFGIHRSGNRQDSPAGAFHWARVEHGLHLRIPLDRRPGQIDGQSQIRSLIASGKQILNPGFPFRERSRLGVSMGPDQAEKNEQASQRFHINSKHLSDLEPGKQE
jgi:hypothetical protein